MIRADQKADALSPKSCLKFLPEEMIEITHFPFSSILFSIENVLKKNEVTVIIAKCN